LGLGPQLPPEDYSGDAAARSTLIASAIYAVIMVSISYFAIKTAVLGCIVAGVRVIVNAYTKDVVRWEDGGEEMKYGRASLLTIGLVWIFVAIALYAIGTNPATN